MTLPRQLLLLSLLILVLPWAGCTYLREIERTLRAGQEATLLASAAAYASALGNRPALLYREPGQSSRADGGLYVHRLASPLALDGYAEDWGVPPLALDGARDVSYLAGIRDGLLYLFVSVKDDSVVYEREGEFGYRSSDHLILGTATPAGAHAYYLFATRAPGPVQARRLDARGEIVESRAPVRADAVWTATAAGYNVELFIPFDQAGTRLALARVNTDDAATPAAPGLPAEVAEPDPFILAPDELATVLGELDLARLRLRVLDRRGWLLGEAGRLAGARAARAPGAVARLFHAMLDTDRPAYPYAENAPQRMVDGHVLNALADVAGTARYRDHGRAVLSAAHPIRAGGATIGAVVVEQSSDAILAATDDALTRLLTLTLLAAGVVGTGLLGFAIVLSLRIRRLRDDADAAVAPDGTLIGAFQPSTRGDELGDLSRAFAALLARLGQYTDYLEGLSGKLSHELRTPLAIVRSSLDNLEAEPLSEQAMTYAQRARDGLDRLAAILAAMSEASHVEGSLRRAQPEVFDLRAVFAAMVDAYADVYPARHFTGEAPDVACPLRGVPDLISQMLDKLVENAADFTPEGGTIALRLAVNPTGGYRIRITNDGPPLPAGAASRLFDSMVTARSGRTSRPHLGFGLFVVRLIAHYHGGTVAARNREDGGGAVFEVSLLAAPAL